MAEIYQLPDNNQGGNNSGLGNIPFSIPIGCFGGGLFGNGGYGMNGTPTFLDLLSLHPCLVGTATVALVVLVETETQQQAILQTNLTTIADVN